MTLVIPAEAGIQGDIALRPLWIPAFAGMTRGGLLGAGGERELPPYFATSNTISALPGVWLYMP
jgi:hypothetical protein